MPCYTVQLVSVEFQVKHRKVLIDALKSLGWQFQENKNTVSIDYGRIVVDLEKGKATLSQSYQGRLNELKRAYSQEAIKLVSAAKGWMNQPDKKQQSMLAVDGQIIKF